MCKNQILLIVALVILIVILGACGNSTAKSNAELANQQSVISSDQDLNEELSNEVSKTEKKNTNSNATISTNKNWIDAKEDSIDTASSANDTSPTSRKDENAGNKKNQFLQKLNDTKNVAEELKALDSSTYALKKVENDRLIIWDDVLNEIYRVLEEQLLPEEMEVLREEQRKWINYRDERALKASQKFKGGTQEHLEYVTVLANLTEERCYKLVEDYMT